MKNPTFRFDTNVTLNMHVYMFFFSFFFNRLETVGSTHFVILRRNGSPKGKHSSQPYRWFSRFECGGLEIHAPVCVIPSVYMYTKRISKRGGINDSVLFCEAVKLLLHCYIHVRTKLHFVLHLYVSLVFSKKYR